MWEPYKTTIIWYEITITPNVDGKKIYAINSNYVNNNNNDYKMVLIV